MGSGLDNPKRFLARHKTLFTVTPRFALLYRFRRLLFRRAMVWYGTYHMVTYLCYEYHQ